MTLNPALILGTAAVLLCLLALRDRLRTGQWTPAARTRLLISALFFLVLAWLGYRP